MTIFSKDKESLFDVIKKIKDSKKQGLLNTAKQVNFNS